MSLFKASIMTFLLSFNAQALAAEDGRPLSVKLFDYISNLEGRKLGEVKAYIREGRVFYQIEGASARQILTDRQFDQEELSDFEGFDHLRVGPFHCVKITYLLDSENLCQVSIHNDNTTSHEAFCRDPICSE